MMAAMIARKADFVNGAAMLAGSSNPDGHEYRRVADLVSARSARSDVSCHSEHPFNAAAAGDFSTRLRLVAE